MTRYLCAAAYLDSEFRDKVLAESLQDDYRAVAPSYGGFDIGPVIHHCRRSRTVLVVRDIAISLLLFIGIFVQPLPTFTVLVFLLPFVLLTARRVRKGPWILRALLWGFAVYTAFYLIVLVIGSFALQVLLPGLFPIGSSGRGIGLGFPFIALATLLVAIGYRIATYLTLAGSLRPGSPEPVVPPTQLRTARRMDYVRRAQWGNITMYANEDAFMGAGGIERVWSIAVELDRVRSEDPTSRRRERAPVGIDPVDLHAYIRDRLIEMRDQVLRPNESIQRLDIGDHVVTRGIFTVADWRGHGQQGSVAHPMIDRSTGRPRHLATPEEIAAIIRHPQGGVRYYQRVTISGSGQEIRDTNGALVAPAEDQEALTSAFIYLAVEGRMLYTQFVVTVLPPAHPLYHVIDLLPAMTVPRIAWEAVKVLKLQLLRDVLAAPFRLGRLAWQEVREALVARDPARYLVYPYGARLSVRELGASPDLQTYIQILDTAKYTKLIEQRLTEAVLDYLEERDVDTGAYRLQAASVISVGAGGTFSGSVSFGSHSSATVTNTHRKDPR
ncbi:hypothetical protein [Streptosporangium sp. KLBMP 9127]|nr:hypothetical protein [Streptosporangium sp. KLBMP 9127]